jgi:hypothetical protein
MSKSQRDVMQKIIEYGNRNGFTNADIEIAIKTAWIESKLGNELGPPSPDSTATGLFAYTDPDWATYHSGDGEKNNFDNQIKAFYEDLWKYKGWYLDPDKSNNIPKDRIDFGEYVYIKHHDGPGYTNYSNAPGEKIWDRVNFQTILLSDEQLLQCHQSFTNSTSAVPPPPRGCPLVLDLDGDGVETTSLNDGSYFDHDANGFSEKTGWLSSDDGLLVLDRNGDGIINDGKELFGDQTILKNGSRASNGFQALAEWDDNLDGKIDANDSIWSNLRVDRGLSFTYVCG